MPYYENAGYTKERADIILNYPYEKAGTTPPLEEIAKRIKLFEKIKPILDQDEKQSYNNENMPRFKENLLKNISNDGTNFIK